MILAIDIGNTSCSCGIFDDVVLVDSWFFPTDPSYSPTDWEVFVFGNRTIAAGRVVVGSVVSSAVPALAEMLANRGLETLVVAPDTPMPVHNKYRTPSTVGIDRLANVVGALHQCGAPAVVVDIGTAITIDCLSGAKEFVGGAILPGPALQARALHAYTAALPLVDPTPPVRFPAASTVEAIEAGILLGTAGSIALLVEEATAVLGEGTTVLYTGGHSGLVMTEAETAVRIEPHLTLIGLREILLYQKTKSDDR